MRLRVSEIFYSLQGEGARLGTPTIFIRLQGCSVMTTCYEIGIRCDTEYASGKIYTLDEICQWIESNAPKCKEITWTGGEPCDQLNEEIIDFFHDRGFFQAIETSGAKPAPKGLDFVCVSPKVSEYILKKNFPEGVTELRYVRHKGQEIPKPSVSSIYKWISPHSDGHMINAENLQHCIRLCLENPEWRLSVQMHKLWKIL